MSNLKIYIELQSYLFYMWILLNVNSALYIRELFQDTVSFKHLFQVYAQTFSSQTSTIFQLYLTFDTFKILKIPEYKDGKGLKMVNGKVVNTSGRYKIMSGYPSVDKNGMLTNSVCV